jgi:predicted phage terminase large subunit-like protein
MTDPAIPEALAKPDLRRSREIRRDSTAQEQIRSTRELRHDQIRELVLEHKRFDVLAEYVLGYDPYPHHVAMMAFQDEEDEGMILGFRGAAKTTYCTVTRAIGEILCDGDIRILFASDAAEQAKTFLREVKQHFEENDKLREIFGDFVTGARIWAEGEIIVNTRRKIMKESTITCVGTDTTLPGRHFDVIIGDDIVTDDNSQTAGQRAKVHDWFYKTLMPCLEPGGRMWILGTRWHEEDLYAWLQAEDYKEAWLHVPALDENDKSIWPEQIKTSRLHRIRKGNLGAFELQYMCTSGKSLGGIFHPDHFTYVDGAYPADLFVWQAVDLAVGQKDRHDFFAHATVGISKETKKPWLFEIHEKKIPFPAQLPFIAAQYEKHPETVRVVIESNAFQLAAAQLMRANYPEVPVQPRATVKDKTVRANQLATIVGPGGIHVRRHHHKFVRHMCAMPNGAHDDQFDAFDLACQQGLRGARKRRRQEPGLI